MSSWLICLTILVWHLAWNMSLNRARGIKWISVEQLVISMITGIILQTIAGWSVWTVVVLISFGSLAYYINLVHIRFFGELIAASQMKQFLFTKETAAVGGAM